MKRSEDIRMPLNIGVQRLYVNVPFERQEFAREVEKEINSLFSKWRREFTAKSDQEILAMVTYQYVSFFRELRIRYGEAAERAEECLRLLENWDTPQPEEESGEEESADFQDFTLESGDF